MSLAIREATEDDLRFVRISWSASYRTSVHAGFIHTDDWRVVMDRQIARILARSRCRVLVAYHTNASTTNDIAGWLCHERGFMIPSSTKVNGRWIKSMKVSGIPLLHYCYTKETRRRMGVLHSLLHRANIDREEEMFLTCHTRSIPKIGLKRARLNPEIVRHDEQEKHQEGRCTSKGHTK